MVKTLTIFYDDTPGHSEDLLLSCYPDAMDKFWREAEVRILALYTIQCKAGGPIGVEDTIRVYQDRTAALYVIQRKAEDPIAVEYAIKTRDAFEALYKLPHEAEDAIEAPFHHAQVGWGPKRLLQAVATIESPFDNFDLGLHFQDSAGGPGFVEPNKLQHKAGAVIEALIGNIDLGLLFPDSAGGSGLVELIKFLHEPQVAPFRHAQVGWGTKRLLQAAAIIESPFDDFDLGLHFQDSAGGLGFVEPNKIQHKAGAVIEALIGNTDLGLLFSDGAGGPGFIIPNELHCKAGTAVSTCSVEANFGAPPMTPGLSTVY